MCFRNHDCGLQLQLDSPILFCICLWKPTLRIRWIWIARSDALCSSPFAPRINSALLINHFSVAYTNALGPLARFAPNSLAKVPWPCGSSKTIPSGLSNPYQSALYRETETCCFWQSITAISSIYFEAYQQLADLYFHMMVTSISRQSLISTWVMKIIPLTSTTPGFFSVFNNLATEARNRLLK